MVANQEQNQANCVKNGKILLLFINIFSFTKKFTTLIFFSFFFHNCLYFVYRSKQYPHEHSYDPKTFSYSNHGFGDHNYCRTLGDGGTDDTIWCYTTQPGTRWERCEPLQIPKIFSKNIKVGSNPTAQLVTTLTGLTGLTNEGIVKKVVYQNDDSGNGASNSWQDTINVQPNILYSIAWQVLRSDLGDSGENVVDVKLDGTSVGGCKPPGGDYDCDFYDCHGDNGLDTFQKYVITSASGVVNVVATFTGNSKDCDCDRSDLEGRCAQENTVIGYTATKAALKFTLTPVKINPTKYFSIHACHDEECSIDRVLVSNGPPKVPLRKEIDLKVINETSFQIEIKPPQLNEGTETDHYELIINDIIYQTNDIKKVKNFVLAGCGTWEETQKQCQILGGDLVVILDAAKNTAVINFMNSFSHNEYNGFAAPGCNGAYPWIGAKDCSKSSGACTWVDGSTWKYTGRFVFTVDDPFLHLYRQDNYNGVWGTHSAGGKSRGICEIEQNSNIVSITKEKSFEKIVTVTFPGKVCFKVVTGSGLGNDGYLTVLLDRGRGYAIEKASTFYGKSSLVFEKCLPNNVRLAVENSNANAWAGSITANDNPMTCTNCDVGKSTLNIVFDGDTDGQSQAPTDCLSGKRCFLGYNTAHSTAAENLLTRPLSMYFRSCNKYGCSPKSELIDTGVPLPPKMSTITTDINELQQKLFNMENSAHDIISYEINAENLVKECFYPDGDQSQDCIGPDNFGTSSQSLDCAYGTTNDDHTHSNNQISYLSVGSSIPAGNQFVIEWEMKVIGFGLSAAHWACLLEINGDATTFRLKALDWKKSICNDDKNHRYKLYVLDDGLHIYCDDYFLPDLSSAIEATATYLDPAISPNAYGTALVTWSVKSKAWSDREYQITDLGIFNSDDFDHLVQQTVTQRSSTSIITPKYNSLVIVVSENLLTLTGGSSCSESWRVVSEGSHSTGQGFIQHDLFGHANNLIKTYTMNYCQLIEVTANTPVTIPSPGEKKFVFLKHALITIAKQKSFVVGQHTSSNIFYCRADGSYKNMAVRLVDNVQTVLPAAAATGVAFTATDIGTKRTVYRGKSCNRLGCSAIATSTNSAEVASSSTIWYCAVKYHSITSNTIVKKTMSLTEAQNSLNMGTENNQQAIVPMAGDLAGNPQDLDKSWTGGSMFWSSLDCINAMRNKCELQTPITHCPNEETEKIGDTCWKLSCVAGDYKNPTCTAMDTSTCPPGKGFSSASGKSPSVTKVTITDREDCGGSCAIRLNGAQVIIGDSSNPYDASHRQCGSDLVVTEGGKTYTLTCILKGRYLFVRLPGIEQILTFAEIKVQIDGTASHSGTVSQSSTRAGGILYGGAAKAIDGDSTTFVHTAVQGETSPWWKLDMNGVLPSIGSTANDGICTDCIVGYSKNGTSPSRCLACHAGQKQLEIGSSKCNACLAGFYTGLIGQTTCIGCPIGSYSENIGGRSVAECKSCIAGQYTDEIGSTICKLCPKGTFLKDNSGNTVYHDDPSDCQKCSKYFYNPFDGHPLSCFPCLSALEEEATTCEGCDPGKFKTAAGDCEDCAPGKVTPDRDLPGCEQCQKGRFSPKVKPYIRCLFCQRGTFGDVVGALTVVEGCTSCVAGRFSADVGLASDDTISCKGCPKGRWSSLVGSQREVLCIPCGAGRYGLSLTGASNKNSCIKCNAGKYSQKIGSFGEEMTCISCPSGFAQVLLGQAYCLPCIPGTVQPEIGKNDCRDCDRNTFQPDASRTKCLDCGVGMWTSEKPGASSCVICLAGEYWHQGSCIICPNGKYRHKDNDATVCSICNKGTYQPNTGQTSCLHCLPGRFQNSTQSKKCFACTLGRYREDKKNTVKEIDNTTSGDQTIVVVDTSASDCFDCPAGFHQSSVGQTSCLPCTPGRFGKLPKQVLCQVCPRNTFTELTLQTLCKNCKIGEYTTAPGSASCITCGAGKFGKSFGTGCSKCPSGWYREDGYPQTDTCVQCKLAETTITDGSASCSKCDFGRYGSERGICLDCSTGRFQDSKGQPDCMDCNLGTVTPGSSSCVKCESGRYGTQEPGVCSACPEHLYQENKGEPNCKRCLDGKIPNERKTACQKPEWVSKDFLFLFFV